MKKAIRFVILFVLGLGIVVVTRQLEITHDAEGEEMDPSRNPYAGRNIRWRLAR